MSWYSWSGQNSRSSPQDGQMTTNTDKILKTMFETYSPDPCDGRFQHSDSAMGHLLPLIGSLGMTGVNFGPTLTVSEIREHCPRAVIDGQLAPFTLCRIRDELSVSFAPIRLSIYHKEAPRAIACTYKATALSEAERMIRWRPCHCLNHSCCYEKAARRFWSSSPIIAALPDR